MRPWRSSSHPVAPRVAALVLALGLLAPGAACNRDKTDPLVRETLGKLKEFRDRGCKCEDSACVDEVLNEQGRWMLQNAKRLSELDKKATPAQNEQGQKISAELNECAKKLANQKPPG